MNFDIKKYIEGNVSFQYYKDKSLWYLTSNQFLFPVPIEDIGNATFNASDKSMLFMRYIRKHLELLNKEESVRG